MSELFPTLVFAFSVLLLFATYAVYPLIFRFLRRREGENRRDPDSADSIAVVIVAKNEAERIESKITNIFEQSVAKRITQLLVVSDNSSDGTQEIVERIAASEPRLQLVNMQTHRGKAAGLTIGFDLINADVVVFSDVRQRFEYSAIENLCANFQNPDVGGVCGELRFPDTDNVIGAYWRYETRLRQLEGNFDSVIGCTGALYAIRRSLFVAPPAGLILDDVWIPMHVVFQGYRVVYEATAVALEPAVTNASGEFRKKVRTLAGNYQLVQQSPDFISPRANRLWWAFILHKLARLAGPFLLLFALLSAMYLPYPANILCTGLQLACYLLAAVAHFSQDTALNCRLCNLCQSFFILNLAAGNAFFKAITKDYDSLWIVQSTTPR